MGEGRRPFRGFGKYWRRLLAGFRRHAGRHWPILVLLLAYPFVSGALLCSVECGRGNPINTYWDAVYVTWITMSTVGYGDKVPVTAAGRLLVSLDALIGLVLIGLIVVLFSDAMRDQADKSP